MKKLRFLLLMIGLCLFGYLQAQNVSKTSTLGSSTSFISVLKGAKSTSGAISANGVKIPLPDGSVLTASVDVIKTYGSKDFFHGKIKNNNSSMFNVMSSGESVEGSIIFKDKKLAYKIYSDEQSNVIVKEESIDDLLCTEYTKKNSPTTLTNALPAGISVADLQSYPSATAVILLDFDGQYVPAGAWGDPIDALPSGMSDDEIYISWQLVSDDFRPFNVNVTTSEAVYQNAPANQRMRAIITPTNTAAPGWGGVAYIGSFTWGNDTPCWVFNLGAKNAGETISHEIGHTLGLGHDGTYDGTNYSEYFWGQNNWGPIMGAAFSPDVVQWSKGEYQYANNQEDDLTIITTRNNFGYRTDASDIGTPVQIITNSAGMIDPAFNKGVIEINSDVDVFYFTKSVSGNVVIGVNQGVLHSNLDVLLTLKDANNTVIATSNPYDSLSAYLNVVIPAGTYYVYIEGVGKESPLTHYSDYASIGQYVITGNLPPSSGSNLALNKPVFSSSVENAGTVAALAVDGNYTTRWSSVFSDPQWITVDLQQIYNIGRVKITWEAAYGRNYTIQTSNTNNGSDWVNLKTVTDNTALVNDWTDLSGSARYIRIYGTTRGTGYGYSIFELEVYEGLPNQAPQVTFTSPTNGSVFSPNSNIALSANASDIDGSVTKVEFFNGTTKLGEDATAPYTYLWTNVPVGNYSLRAIATDNGGATAVASITIRVEVPNPPTVSITSPANGATFRVNESFILSASASDADGSITKVDFYLNGEYFNTDFTAPYEFQVSVSIPITETATAVAYDNSGLSTTSAPVTLTITDNVLPNLALNKPTFASSIEHGGTPSAFAVDGNSTSRWSSAFSDPQWITVDLGAIYNINRVMIAWEAAYGRDYKIQLSNTNNGSDWSDIKTVAGNTALTNDWTGLSGSGRYIRVYGTARGTGYGYSIYELQVYGTPVNNVAPEVTITTPANNSSITYGQTVIISANAMDADGTITKVEFYTGSSLINTALNAPYTIYWPWVGVGTYVITAKAYDNTGAVTTSSPITIHVVSQTNLALNKPTSASSIEYGGTPSAFAVDGNSTSRWSSAFSDPQWITVDLGASYNINRVMITWEAAYGKNYKIQLSNTNNGSDWTDIMTVTNNTALTNDWTALAGSGRYVRIYGTARGTVYGYSIYELEVYGTATSASLATEELVNAFPVPAYDYVTISFSSEADIEATAELVLIDPFLQQVASYTKAKGASEITINTSSLNTGAYLLKINTGRIYSTKRILVSR